MSSIGVIHLAGMLFMQESREFLRFYLPKTKGISLGCFLGRSLRLRCWILISSMRGIRTPVVINGLPELILTEIPMSSIGVIHLAGMLFMQESREFLRLRHFSCPAWRLTDALRQVLIQQPSDARILFLGFRF
jgi:hypothetical protein